MKRIILCLSLFAFFVSQAQQINPVPDYVFSNKMSVGRNAVTDTAAYFSIGPRYGAIRGMMPPMVTDTASMSATKRNGLLIFSIQKNKYLYWDSVGSKWAEMAGTAGSAITGSGVAGYMPEFTTATNIDTTRLYHSNGRFAIGSTTTTNGVFNVYGGRAYFDTSVLVGSNTFFADEANTRIGIGTTSPSDILTVSRNQNATTRLLLSNTDASNSSSRSELQLVSGIVTAQLTAISTGGGITKGLWFGTNTNDIVNFVINGSAVMTLNTSGELIIDNSGTAPDAGAYKLQVAGSIYNTTGAVFAASSGEVLIGTTTDAGAYALQVSGAIYNTTGAVLAASSGNVGIGTSSPEAKLHVLSNANPVFSIGGTRTGTLLNYIYNASTATDAAALLAFAETSPASALTPFWIRRYNSTHSTFPSVIEFWNFDNAPIRFATNNTERLRVKDDGEILIGSTSDAGTYALQVTGAIYNTTTITTGAPTGGSIKPWRLGEAATVSPTSPNRTIRVEIDGTVYYIHAKTTND